MVRSFMIRGTHGPMQTLLDWRTYGLKVHYNTTTPGHVGWMGSDELLYKDVYFTMSAFRGFIHGLVGSARELLWELVAQYLTRVARFKEKLAVAIHVTGGQPARAPELLSIQHVNTQASRHRNIFIEDGMVTAVTAYHKGFHASNDIKLIHWQRSSSQRRS
ncbi:Putative Superfamily II DNA helicase [Aspergillus calidoustus]|uniref:Putative Superfamily II DNA helicase n=1 Tax=Aspergillus calidoustus TaxID=454130 RepID=A0A0U5GNY8_ASPCI|nr:Putative Superfamily II DNA helicase [Aspergillus calidoustus]